MNFSEFYNDPRFSDVQIKIGEKTIYAHKILLMVSSPVLRLMLLNSMKESNSRVIELKEHSFNSIECAIRWMYEWSNGDDFQHSITRDEFIDYIAVADFLQLNNDYYYTLCDLYPDDCSIAELIRCAHLYDFSSILMDHIISIIYEDSISYDGKSNGDEKISFGKDIIDQLIQLDLDEYIRFRKRWLDDEGENIHSPQSNSRQLNFKLTSIFEADCFYCSSTIKDPIEARHQLSQFIKDIKFNKITSDISNFPIVCDPDVLQMIISP